MHLVLSLTRQAWWIPGGGAGVHMEFDHRPNPNMSGAPCSQLNYRVAGMQGIGHAERRQVEWAYFLNRERLWYTSLKSSSILSSVADGVSWIAPRSLCDIADLIMSSCGTVLPTLTRSRGRSAACTCRFIYSFILWWNLPWQYGIDSQASSTRSQIEFKSF